MKITPEFRIKLEGLLKMQMGVLSSDDLWLIISPTSKVDFYRQLKKLKTEKLIFDVCRGFFVGKGYSRPALIMAIKPESYLSLEFALAYYNMIGTYSEEKIRPILPTSTRSISISDGLYIDFKKLSKDLIFGFEVKDGIKVATKEKAFLDTLYFYLKGTKFYFDIYSDIDVQSLNKKKLFSYLKKYKNPKFIKFVKGYFND